MWHPFKKKDRIRAENEFAQVIEQSLTAAEGISDKGERLLELDRIRQVVDGHVEWLQMEEARIAHRKLARRVHSGFFGSLFGGLAIPVLMPGATVPVLIYMATVYGVSGGGMGLGFWAKKKYISKNEKENKPILERLGALGARAGGLIDDTLAAHLQDVGKSPHFAEVMARLPQAREAFAKVAANLPDKPSPPPPPKPGQGFNL